MSQRSRLAAGLVLGAIAFCLFAGHAPSSAQVRVQFNPAGGRAPATPPGPPEVRVELNKKVSEGLARAKKALQTADFAGAIEFLQERIADRPDDFFLDQSMEMSAKEEVRRIFEELSDEQRRHYLLRYAEPAKQLLDEAKRTQDMDKLAEVARRFAPTDAGAEATYLLASAQLDRGRPLQAAVALGRMTPASRAQWEPTISIKEALGWRQAGFPAEARAALIAARKRNPQARFGLAARPTSWFDAEADALAWLDRQTRCAVAPHGSAAQTRGAEDWSTPRGAPGRNGSAAEASPLWRPTWTASTLARDDSVDAAATARVRKEIDELRAKWNASGLLAIPAAVPVAAVDVVPPVFPKALEGAFPSLDVVVFRTLSNVRAVHVATGHTVWQAYQFDPAYERLVDGNYSAVPQNPQYQNPLTALVTQRAWRDLTAGTLSVDGERVYSVEDVGVLTNYPQYLGARAMNSPFGPADSNRLMAFELATGRMKWEVGGPRLGRERELPLAGTFFLGPPLSLDGKLYILGESGGEVSMHALNAADGSPLWSQSLALPEASLELFGTRRLVGISPAESNGMLVCPTDCGLVVGIDLAERRLAWAMKYDVNTPAMRTNQPWAFPVNNTPGRMNPMDDESRWIDSTPLIAEGHVVVTPRDSDEMHCVRLHDGAVVWRRPRGSSLSVAAIHDGAVVVVGRNQVEALRLARPDDGKSREEPARSLPAKDATDDDKPAGAKPVAKAVAPEPAWPTPTPIPNPSGRGVRCGGYYHIPLSTGEIATLDLKSGRLLARSKTREGTVPGNLIAVRGALVSQTIDAVTMMESLETVETHIADALAADANNADALALRGSLHLHRGREAEALADLRRATESDPKSPARPALVAALLERYRHDFAAHRDLGPEIERLADDPRQKAEFFRLNAAGLLRVGERTAAFTQYLKLAGTGAKPDTLEKLNDDLSVRSDRWIRARLREIADQSTTEERRAFDDLVRASFDEVLKKDDAAALRGFLGVFGNLPLADQVRRRLCDLLDPKTDALAIELLLLQARESADLEVAGDATRRLVALYLERDRANLAPALITELQSRFAAVLCDPEGNTGAELAERWKSDDAVLQLFAGTSPWPDRKLEVTKRNAGGAYRFEYPLEFVGPRGAFDRWQFAFDQQRVNIVARDGLQQDRWSVRVDHFQDRKRPNANPLNALNGNNNMDVQLRAHGHLLAARLGNFIGVTDALGPGASPRVLWARDLAHGQPVQYQHVNANGIARMRTVDMQNRPVGTMGFATADCFCFQVGTTLYGVDPLTGETLWERRNAPRAAEIFGDRDHIFLVPQDSNQATAYRAIDGEPAGAQTLPPFGARLLLEGRTVVAKEPRDDRGGTLYAVDPLTGGRLWHRDYLGDAKTYVVGAAEIALLEPRGKFAILDARDGAARVEADIGLMENLGAIVVLRTADRYVLITDTTQGNNPVRRMQNQTPWIRVAPVHGPIWGFDRQTGKPVWTTRLENQAIDVNHPADLPLLAFVAYRYHPPVPGGRFIGQEVAIDLLDLRNGRFAFQETQRSSSVPYRLTVDTAKKQIALDIQGTGAGYDIKVGDSLLPPADLPTSQKKSAIPLDQLPQ